MKAAEDQVVGDDARFQDDEVGLCAKRLGLEESLLPFTLELLCISPSQFSEQKQKVQNKSNIESEVKSDKENMQILSDTLNHKTYVRYCTWFITIHRSITVVLTIINT